MGSERLVKSFPLSAESREASLNFDINFDEDFQFVRGGKLHGLGPRVPIAGGKPIQPAGWSARVMWRAAGEAETYTYHQEQPGSYGDSGLSRAPFKFTRERYYAISLHVTLNHPVHRANGSVHLYVDGQLIDSRGGIRFRSVDTRDSLISKFLFSTFHGGNDPSWAPRARSGAYGDVHAYFDNIAVFAGKRIRATPGCDMGKLAPRAEPGPISGHLARTPAPRGCGE